MRHVTRYRLYPDEETTRYLEECFRHCSFVYNYCLDEQVFVDNILPRLKFEHPELKEVHSKVLQNVIKQLRFNLKGLKALKDRGNRVGRLRNKRLKSMIFEQSGFKIVGNKLRLYNIGEIPIKLSRAIPGKIKQIVVKYNKTHKWFASIISETDEPDISDTEGNRSIGIDLNVSNFSTDSDGLVVDHPHNVKLSKKKLGREQRRLSRKRKGSKNYRKQKILVAEVHETTVNRRKDFLHKLSKYYVDNYDLIVLEDLDIKNMLKDSFTKKEILDAGWRLFGTFVGYKAERAGKYYAQIDPYNTTQDCSGCGKTVRKGLGERTHSCPYCGTILPRDYNAALNIKFRGLEKVGWGTAELWQPVKLPITLAEMRTSILDIPEQVRFDETRISRL